MGRGARIARVGVAVAAALLALTLALAGARPAIAAPMLAIDSPLAGSVTDHSTVTISGNTSYVGSAETPTEVTVKIYEGTAASGTPLQPPGATPSEQGAWSVSMSLADGTYTAVAEQSELGETSSSPAVTFKVDTTAPKVTMNAVQSPTNNPSPTLSGKLGTEEGDEASVAVTILSGTTVVESGSATISPGGWTYAVQKELSDGTYTARATQTDEAGNTGTASRTFTVKKAAPKPTLDAVATPTNNPSPTLKGQAGAAEGDLPQVAVTIYQGRSAGGTVQIAETVPVSNESWTYSPSALPDGTYTAQATQRDEAGNSGNSEERSFTVDTVGPKVTIDPISSPTNHAKPTLEGKLGSEPGDVRTVFVTIHEGSSSQGAVAASGNARVGGESWSYSPEGELSAGTYTAVADQEDIAHNVGHAQLTFTIKTARPVVTLNPPEADTNNATPTFSGSADTGEGDIASVTVRVYASSTVVRFAEASVTGGSWSTGSIEKLPDGTYTVQAEQKDEAGNSGVSSRPSFTIDTVAPVVALKPVPAATKSPTPAFTGTAGIAPGDDPTVTVTISGTTAAGTHVSAPGTAHVGKKGEWSFTAAALEEGSYSVQASQSDEAHNVGLSVAAPFKVITKPPTVVLNPPAARSNNREPTFSGTASAPTEVTVTVDNEKGEKASQVKAVPGAGGVWTTGPAKLPNEKGQKAYSATATQVDEAGNSTTTARVKFIVDTEAPSVSLAPPPARTNNRTPTFNGTASELTPVTVDIYAAGGPAAEPCIASGAPVASAAAAGTGAEWSSGATSAPLADGHYVAIAVQSSRPEYGSHCSETAPAPFTIDTIPPFVAISSPPGNSAAVATSQLVSGTADTAEGDLPGVTAELFAGEGIDPQRWIQSAPAIVAHGSWSVTFAGLPAGVYTVRATQGDEAGNVGISAQDVFRLISPAPIAGKPTAAFSWYPASPHAGETVTLVSSSTDPTSPLTGFAWDLAGNGALLPGAGVIATSFATAGSHTVRLRVTDASGATSTAGETIPVGAPAISVLEPFPLVRIVTTRSGSGLRLSVLSILAARGARVTITCRGRGCPLRKESKVASAGKVGLVSVSFARFQRMLPVGTLLEIRAYEPGKIGKYTSLSVRRGGVLRRIDKCLSPNGTTPMTCPTR